MKTWNRMLKRAAVAGAAVGVAVGAAACSRADAQAGDESSAAAPQVVTVTARDFNFEAPAEIAAGPTTFRLVNAGQALHHVQLVKLDDGKTLQDVYAALQAGGPPPAWVHWVGGPNAPDPGSGSNATLVLEPGNYALLCFVDIPDHVPHVMKGMARALRVTAPATTPVANASNGLPAADVVMTLNDYSFTLSKPLTAGRHTIRVQNAARQPHEVELVRLAPGKTFADLEAWMGSMQGPPPASAIGGVAGLEPGVVNNFDVDLAAGDYVLICFLPDAKDGKPHLMHGMVQTIHVE
ncbi:MAG TPA: hypothetical protein VF746_23390 [Longimicrobium sp.]|jgi:hypothetical protein